MNMLPIRRNAEDNNAQRSLAPKRKYPTQMSFSSVKKSARMEGIETPNENIMDFFQSERLIYRAWSLFDEDEWLFNCRRDLAVYPDQQGGFLTPITRDVIPDYSKEREGKDLYVVICEKEKNISSPAGSEVDTILSLGIFSVKILDVEKFESRRAEFYIEIQKEEQGKGYGSETLRWGLRWAFHMAGMHKVVVKVFEWNVKAIRAFQKAGFQIEGRLRESIWRNGQWWDEIILGVLEHQWRARTTVKEEPHS